MNTEKEKIVSDLLDERKKREEQGEQEEQEFDVPFNFELSEVELLKLENLQLKKKILNGELEEVLNQEQGVFTDIVKRAEKPVGDWFVQVDPRNISIAKLSPKPKQMKPEETDGI